MIKLYFVSGLPRSGSTLLMQLLAQNLRFAVTGTSGMPDVLHGVKRGWNTIPQFRAIGQAESDTMMIGVLRGSLYEAYSHVKKPVLFEKSRDWPNLIETLLRILPQEVKILAPVRDIPEILSSFEIRYRVTNSLGAMAFPEGTPNTLEGRIAYWASKGPVGGAYTAMREAYVRGFANLFHIIEFDDLTSNPVETMRGIYGFLGEKYFEHDFDNVEQVTYEDDRNYGFSGLHVVSQKVEPVQHRSERVLGELAKKYKGQEFWRKTKEKEQDAQEK